MYRFISFAGLWALVGVAWLMSSNRRRFPVRVVLWGVGLQFLFGAVILIPAAGEAVFDWVDVAIRKLMSFSEQGSDFVFQTIQAHEIAVVDETGVAHPMTFIGTISPPVKTFAFWTLPTVIFFSALMTVGYHYGIMQRVVGFFARIMQYTMKTSGAESLSSAANIFVGQTEAPLLVRPFVKDMTVSELNAVMVGGFATIAGGVMAMYVGVLGHIEGIAGHLVIASIMSAPASLAIAKVMVPETEEPKTLGRVTLKVERIDVNGLDALSRGALDGLKLALNIAAMLLVFVAVIAMVNAVIGAIGNLFGVTLSLQILLGWLFAPFAFLIGIPWAECNAVGVLLGEKMILTELIAYLHLSELQSSVAALSERSAIITSYALCGFANFASIGIQIGGIGGIAPERRGDLARIGFKAMIGGTIAAMMTASIAGILI